MSYDLTLDHHVHVADTNVATVTLDRPRAYNALTADLLEALLASFVALERDDRVRAIVLTGNGNAFCAGQALDDARTLPPDAQPALHDAVVNGYSPLVEKLLTLEKPIVAAVNGVAAGAGMGIALSCDFRIVAEEASFTTAFAKIGLVADSAISYLLPRMVGYTRAVELLMLSSTIDARKAVEIGLVNAVVAGDALAAEARTLAERLAHGPRSLGLLKRELVHNGLGALRDALAYEAQMQAVAGATDDFVEGLAAFRGKRAAAFSGR